jgi:hypothetical protein
LKPKSDFEDEKPENKPPLGYTKEQLLQSKRFTTAGRDVLNVVLEDGKRYTLPEVKRLTEAWLKKEAR